MADAGRPSSMSSHKLRRLAAAGRGEQLVPQLFVTREEGGPIPRHVVTIDDVTKGLGLDAALAERVHRLIAGTNVSFEPKGASQRLVDGRSSLVEFLRQQDVNSDVRQEIARRALAYWRRTQTTDLKKEPKMRYVFKSTSEANDLEKAAGHKYISRKPDGRGGWTYEYAVPKKGDMHSRSSEAGHVAELKEGTELRDGDFNGIPYKRKIEKVEHDEKTGETHFHVTGYRNGPHDKYTSHADGSISREGRKLISSTAANALRPESGYSNPKAKYISVEKKADGSHEVKEHLTKLAATNHGKIRRAAGADIFVHSKADAEKHGLDPRKPKAEDTAPPAPAKPDNVVSLQEKKEERAKSPKIPKRIPKEGIPHSQLGDAGDGKVWIMSSEGPQKVDAQKFGNFAVHKQEHDEIVSHGGIDKAPVTRTHTSYAITHLPTGLRLHSIGTKLEAQRYARHMQDNANDVLASSKFGKTDFSNTPAGLKTLREHHDKAVAVVEAAYKSERRFVLGDLQKGEPVAGHKYLRREPDGKGGWHYIYETTKPQKVSHTEGKDKVEWDPHKGVGHIVTNGKRHELVKNPYGISVREQHTGKHSWESSGKVHHVGPSNMTGRQLHEAAKHALSRKADNPRHKVNPNRMSSPHKHERRHDYQD